METNHLLTEKLCLILAVWFLYLALVTRAVRTWHFAQKILSEVLQRIVTLGYMLGVLHLCREPWRRLVKRTPWTLDKVWGCQKRKWVTNFQKESQILSLSVGVWKQRICGGSFEQTMPGNLSVESPRGSGGSTTIILWKQDQDSHDYRIEQILIRNRFNHTGHAFQIVWDPLALKMAQDKV